MKSVDQRIVKCKPEGNYCIWVRFRDGLEGIVDLSDLKEVPAFKKVWGSQEDFNKVRVDPLTYTITWGENDQIVDVNPAELRKAIAKTRS